uniref:caskin-1-like n=1 Tax=Oncorhynchus gorbuscha TaxID=8017 RepID=UPI001EAE9FB7|nr:caskin-1-like [Oncorhynchus gorbuscha]
MADALSVTDFAPRYATVCRSSSAQRSDPNDATVNRSQSSVTLRPRRKGRPPTPPKRSCSSISGGDGLGEGLGVVGIRERRASDCGGLAERRGEGGLVRSEGAGGSVRSIAAMLETSMGGVGPGGGGAKTLPRTMGGRGSYLNPTQFSPGRRYVARPGQVVWGLMCNRRQAGSGGLGSHVLVRRRCAARPGQVVWGLMCNVCIIRQVSPAALPARPGQVVSEPRPRSTVVTPTGEGLITDGTATINRRRKPRPPNYSDAEKFHLTETDTIRRRPRSNDQSDNSTTSSSQPEISTTSVDQPASAIPGSDQPESSRKSVDQPESSIDQLHRSQLAPQQVNGGVDQSHRIILRMRPGSEAEGEVASRRESCDRPEVRKPLKPPVSPKPSMAAVRRQQQDPPTPTRRVPLPGPEADSPADPRWMPPPVSFKPCPPPTGPKPTKPSLSSPTPLPRPLPIPDTLTPPSLSPVPPYTSSSSPTTSPSTPQTPSTPGSTPHPVKPPRSSISGLSVDLLSLLEEKTTVNILDDIGSMFDDLADQLDAMLD